MKWDFKIDLILINDCLGLRRDLFDYKVFPKHFKRSQRDIIFIDLVAHLAQERPIHEDR